MANNKNGWSEEDLSLLGRFLLNGRSVQECAGLFDRTVHAIINRARTFGLSQHTNEDGSIICYDPENPPECIHQRKRLSMSAIAWADSDRVQPDYPPDYLPRIWQEAMERTALRNLTQDAQDLGLGY